MYQWAGEPRDAIFIVTLNLQNHGDVSPSRCSFQVKTKTEDRMLGADADNILNVGESPM